MPPKETNHKSVLPHTPSDPRGRATQPARHSRSNNHPAMGSLQPANVSFSQNIPHISTPHRSDHLKQSATPQSSGTTISRTPAVHLRSMDDPFQDQSRQLAGSFIDSCSPYNKASSSQQLAYGHEQNYLRAGEQHQQPRYPQPLYDRAQYDQSGYGQNTHTHQYDYDTQQASHQLANAQQQSVRGHQQSDHSRYSNPRAAVQIPPAVKGTPSYAVRMAIVESMANENFLNYFHQLTEDRQQEFLRYKFPAVETQNTSAHDQTQTRNVSSGLKNQPLGRRQQQVAVIPHVRDPAPYTGFGAGKGKQSDTPRTVLHDPVAAHQASRYTSRAAGSTLKPYVSEFKPLNNQPAQTQSSDAADPPSTSWGYEDALDVIRRIERNRALTNHFGQAHHTHHNLQAAQAPHDGATQVEPCEAQTPAQVSTQSTAATGSTPIGAAPEMLQVQRTHYGHPIPHGGFTDFETPYDKNFMGLWTDYPEPFRSQEAWNTQLQYMSREQRKDHETDLAEGVAWFRANSSAEDVKLQTIVNKLTLGSEQVSASNITATSAVTGRANPLPTPIGHERASAARQAIGTSNITTSNLMRNPTARDGIDLMAGTITNLRGYATGSDIGGYFTNWTRPAEHAIDKSSEGNKSVFDRNWGTPPARVGRDPRYQQTITTDGRATYFEDPARGSRQ